MIFLSFVITFSLTGVISTATTGNFTPNHSGHTMRNEFREIRSESERIWSNEFRNEEELINCLFDNYRLEDDALLLLCETDLQSMKLFSLRGFMECYPVSTSGKGIGNEEGSFQTPLGMHQIISVACEKCKEGTLIKGMIETRTRISPIKDSLPADGDYLTTRVLVLKGLDKGINSGGSFDSYQRGVVIHGTPEEGFIGQAKSKGCIRMYNDDIIKLSRNISERRKIYLYIME